MSKVKKFKENSVPNLIALWCALLAGSFIAGVIFSPRNSNASLMPPLFFFVLSILAYGFYQAYQKKDIYWGIALSATSIVVIFVLLQFFPNPVSNASFEISQNISMSTIAIICLALALCTSLALAYFGQRSFLEKRTYINTLGPVTEVRGKMAQALGILWGVIGTGFFLLVISVVFYIILLIQMHE